MLLMLVPIGFVIWLRTGDRMGDVGMTNGLTGMAGILLGFITLLWFTFARGYRWRTRLLTLAGIVIGVVVFRSLFRIEAFTGSLIPVVVSRFAEAAPIDVTPVAEARVDLRTRTGFDYPGFLGGRRDLHVPGVSLERDWTAHPPERLWRQPIGAGWSAFAIVNGHALTQEERAGRQMVTCYDAETGALQWAHSWGGALTHSMGGAGPRSTPLVDGGRVYAQGPFGRLVCLDGVDGSVVWEVDLLDRLGLTREQDRAVLDYGRANSPYVHGERLIVAGGGRADSELINLFALDKDTGEHVWSGSRHQISYSSPNVATLAGVEQVLIVNESTVTGHDPHTGRLLWEHPWPGRSNADASAAQAVPIPPASVLVSKGYGVGMALLDLAPRDDGTLAVEQRWHHRRSLRTKYTNALVRDGHAYGLSDGILECVELDGGRRVWKDGRYGHGQVLGVGDLLLVLTEDGELLLLEPRPDRPNAVLGRVQALEGLTWNNLALHRDLLLVRNGHEATAFRLARTDEPARDADVGSPES
jgi:outer membrane protein assembly factor BamB